MIETLNIILIIFILVTAVAAVYVSELISATFLLGCFSFFLAILWALLNAPDVSFTEAMVGAGASTLFFLLAIFGTTQQVKPKHRGWRHAIALILISGLGVFWIWASQDLPELGAIYSPPNAYLSTYYLENAYAQMKTPNTVTAIVVDYRGFDTLIESAVIFTAMVACMLILQKEKGGPQHD